MTFQRLQWLFPIALTLHNLEEAVWLPAWDQRHAAQLPMHPPGVVEFRAALFVLTLAAFAVTFLSARHRRQSVAAYLTFGYIVGLLANVLIPHLPAAIYFRGYAPGVVTAVLINLPLMSLLVVRALREGWVSGFKAAAFGIGVPLAMGSAIAAWVAVHS